VDLEVEGEAECLRNSAGIEHIRDSCLSVQVGRFFIVWVERHSLCHAVWHASRGQKCIVSDSGDCWAASGLYGP